MKGKNCVRTMLACLLAGLCMLIIPTASQAQAYLDNETIFKNQDPNNETRRSDHFRVVFGHYDRDGANAMSEQFVQGNLQMFEHMWNRWVNELGLHDINESVTKPDGKKYRADFHFLMTWNDGGGGGSWSSMDANGFFYAMSNPVNCRFDPPSGATPHEFGHVWEGSAAGFNGTDSSGAWWECTANWMMLQFSNSYPNAGGLLANSMYYPAHGRDYYDTFAIWETAKDDSRYGVEYVNDVWTNATPDQQANEFIIDRMVRLDSSGSLDKANANRDLWGDMARRCITWDYERQRWLAQANSTDDGSDWGFYQRCRTPLVKVAGTTDWYMPGRDHLPMEYGFNMIPLSATPGTTVSCNFQPLGDPIRQSDWRASLVAVSKNGDARYSNFWNVGTNHIKLSNDETKLYLVVIATPKPMKIGGPDAYRTDAGLQFPYRLSFTNATPKNVVVPKPTSGVTWRTRTNPDGSTSGAVASTATVDATAYIAPNAMVLNTAKVLGNARVEDYAVVRGSAQVSGNAVVSGYALIEGNAKVYGNAKVRDWGHVFGYAEVYDNAKVIEHANCGDGSLAEHSKVYGNAIIKGTTYVYNASTILGCSIWDGDTANGGTSIARGVAFGWAWGWNNDYWTSLADNAYVYEQHTFEKDNAVFAMDQYGINHGILMNGCRSEVDTVTPTRGGRVLPLDGVSQYVELHNSVNDFRETAISVWVKWTGTAYDQRIWSMGDGGNNYMYITPRDSTTGNARFVISKTIGDPAVTTTQYVDGPAPIPANTWTHVAVAFSGTTATLYVNGSAVGTNAAMTVFPDQLNAPLMENCNYLGRGNAGNYFQGCVDDFRVYMKALTAAEISTIYSQAAPAPVSPISDVMAPTPNAATWLISPVAIADSAIKMSATPGSDASGWVEYYFDCTSGPGHDSGWVSFNQYTDFGLTPGTACTYTVKMRDRAGNTTNTSVAAAATPQTSTIGATTFIYGPIGISSSAITMTANKLTSPSGLVEYKFTRNDGVTSDWQASNRWTNTGLTAGSSYTYTVQVRDGRGNTSAVSAPVAATAADMAAPRLPIPVAHWQMQPYSTVDNKVCMTAQPLQEANAQIYYECISGGGPDSGWLSASTTDDQGRTYYIKWTSSSALADGTYYYRYKVKDSAGNESQYSTIYPVSIKPTTGYHSYTMSQLAGLPDDYLVAFNGTVIEVRPDSYLVKDTAGSATIVVKTSAYGQATDATNLFKNVTVKGHLYTYSGIRVVTYSTVTPTGSAATYTISGKVTDSGGVGVAGATVWFSTAPNAREHPNCTATTDASGNYSRTIINGTWYVAVSAADYYPSTDQTIVVNGASVANANFVLASMPRISGKVTTSSGAPLPGASVCFSRVADATNHAVYTAITDASGNYTRGVDGNTTWYVSAKALGYGPAADAVLSVQTSDIGNTNFVLTPGGDGLTGEYFDNNDLTSLKVTRVDPTVDFNWTNSAPDSSIALGDFSVRWTGQVKPRYSQTYTFYTRSDDGVRLWVNNKLLVDNWTIHGDTENSGSITLSADKWYSIKMEYFQGSGGSVARLLWSSPSQAKELIPQSRLWSAQQATYAVSGKVTDLNGQPIAGAAVSFSETSNGETIGFCTTNASGNYSQILSDGTWYVYAGASGYLTSAVQPVVVNGAPLTDVNFALGTNLVTRNIPRTSDLLFGAVTESFPATGATGPWAALYPSGLTLGTIGSPTVDVVDGVKWEKNIYSDNDGYTVGTYASNIPVQGVTIVAAVRPEYLNVGGEARGEIVDCFYGELFLAVGHNDGHVIVCLRGYQQIGTGYYIPNGQKTILSLVVQPGGNVVLYANGVQKWSYSSGIDYTKLVPTNWRKITIGRNEPDGWSTFGGNIGDVFFYKVALTNEERLQLEADLTAKFVNTVNSYTITSSAGTGGSISPSGFVTLSEGANQTFTITPSAGYRVADVIVDGASQGAISTYTFPNVSANHTISATFEAIRYTITASAGLGGSINPSGSISIIQGQNQAFTITPNTGYAVDNVLVDDVSQGSITSYTFPNVQGNHTISASFKVYTGPAPTAFYQFENNVLDTMNAYNGTAYGSPTYVTGKIGTKAIQFNGSSQYVSINRPVSTNWTIAFWVKTTQTSLTGTQWYNGSGIVDGEVSGAKHDFGISYLNSKLAFGVGNTDKTIQSTSNINSGNWVHVACTRNSSNGQMKIYINGVLETTGTGPTGTKSAATTLNIGRLRTGINYFNAAIDQLRIYNSVLTASDIAVLVSEGTTYTITASAGPNGSISPSGAVTVSSGGSQMFTITPLAGYGIASLKIGDSYIPPVTNYTFANVTANNTISATFDKIYGANNSTLVIDGKVIGKLVRAWGKVGSYVDGGTTFTIDDGYGTPVAVKINGATLPSGFATDTTVVVTGLINSEAGAPVIYAQGIVIP